MENSRRSRETPQGDDARIGRDQEWVRFGEVDMCFRLLRQGRVEVMGFTRGGGRKQVKLFVRNGSGSRGSSSCDISVKSFGPRLWVLSHASGY